MRTTKTWIQNLLCAVTLTLAACGTKGLAANDPALDVDPSQLPPLNVVQRATFSHPYSCAGSGQLGYDGSALFLSSYSRQRNAPELLYNGACGSIDYIEATTAGDDFGLIADLGPVPIQDVTSAMAFNYRRVVGSDNTFTQETPVLVGHTYTVLISKSDIRALFVLHVDEQFADGPMTISYAVKSYSVQASTASSPGFSWTETNSNAPAAGSTGAVHGSASLGSDIACGTDPASDCRGVLFIGVIDRPAPLPEARLLGSALIPAADLSGGRTASYSIAGLPAGSYYIAAMLVETGTPGNPPYPKTGDLVQAPRQILVQAGSTATVDIALAQRW
jgi:hypothetical protein